MSFDELIGAAKVYVATTSHREFLTIVVTFAMSLVSLTAAVFTYLSNRTLREELETTRERLNNERGDAIRSQARVDERGKTLDTLEGKLEERSKRITVQEQNRARLLDVLKQSDEDLWIRHQPIGKPADHDAKIGSRKLLVLLVANNKGGVGKSTLTLNMAAHFDKHPLAAGKKRLLIDMDYQGTTSYVLTTAIEMAERDSRSQVLMTKGASALALFNSRIGLNPVLPGSELVPSFYELARHEDRLLMEWLLGETDDDLRYRLANILHSDAIIKQYDLVLIDAPPRLTTGTMNALCASTHLIVPTAFTAMSAEPVANFLAMARAVKDKLNPNLKMIGVVETLRPTGRVGNAAEDARELSRLTVQRALQRYFPDASILEKDVPRLNQLAEEGIPYQDDPRVQAIFEQLCAKVKEELT